MSNDFSEILVPSLGVNESSGTLIEWVIDQGSYVNLGDLIAIIETTKVAVEVEASGSGYIEKLSSIGDEVHVGHCIGLLFDSKSYSKEGRDLYLSNKEKLNNSVSYSATRKAEALAKELCVDLNLVAKKIDGIIRESDVTHFHSETTSQIRQTLNRIPVIKGNNGRVLVLGGGKGATQVLSVLLHEDATQVVGILDDTADKQGSSIMGVPILGYVSDLESVANHYEVESVICSVSTSIKFRKAIFKEARKLNLRLANAIHASVNFDDDVLIGSGNYIGANCYFGNATSLGDYCFISSGCIFEHHNVLGSGITTGPHVVTSGSVTIGDEVRFGTGIYLEPNLKIGNQSVISSGSCITDHVPDKAVLRKEYNQHFK
jgi:sugar O-acyltransferase (sialic acid O-acetyltransferase NeuD family)